MSITSETQRKYDPNKGGFSYYTLFHADKGERPSWAQDGDMLEEFGEGGKAYVCSRDAKGRIKWTEKADWDRQTGGGSSEGGGLPADFPAEGAANKNKFLGFDNSGDYAALDAPSGGAEKFVVTLTADDSGAETVWTADKTIAEIVAADVANQVVVAKYPNDGIFVELPLNVAMEYQGMYAAVFVGLATSGNDNKIVAVQCMNEGSGDAITIIEQQIPTSSNAPLIVTMTESEQTPGTYVGDKTYGEVLSATLLGKNVTIAIGSVAAFNVLSVQAESSAYYIFVSIGGDSVAVHGSEEDYVTLSID